MPLIILFGLFILVDYFSKKRELKQAFEEQERRMMGIRHPESGYMLVSKKYFEENASDLMQAGWKIQ